LQRLEDFNSGHECAVYALRLLQHLGRGLLHVSVNQHRRSVHLALDRLAKFGVNKFPFSFATGCVPCCEDGTRRRKESHCEESGGEKGQ
jgi:hypothetical protein